MRNLPRLILLTALSPAAYSQSVLYTFDGDSAGDEFGRSVSSAGDVNGDGFPDLIVGAPDDDNSGKNSGSARVFSGLDGSVLYTFNGNSQSDRFGWSVSGAGDVNGDGFDDLIVGASFDNPNGVGSGSAQVFSGADGSVLYTFDGDSSSDTFGVSVSGAGDVNGDGFDDLIVGALNDDNNGHGSGSARVLSGVDGSILYTLNGASAGDHFGFAVRGVGDVDGDGFDDLIVGAYDGNGGSGSARVFSGVDGSTIHTFNGDSAGDRFGYSVSGAGDVDGDGYPDLIVGAYLDDNNGTDSGSARVFSGVDGSVLYAFDGDSAGDGFGFSVSGAGDVNGDGYDDLIVGATNFTTGAGYVRVFSGLDGSTIHTLNGDSAKDAFGISVSGVEDMNGDGLDDLIVGAIWDDNNGTDSGSARVFSGCDACEVSIGQNYCGPANFNSTGLSAVISAFGSTAASENFVKLTACELPRNVFGYFLNSDVQGFTPFAGGSSGNLCLAGGIGRHAKQIGNTGAAGELVIDVDLTALPRPGGSHSVVAGETWNFQCWFRDNQGGPTSNFTDGISILFN